MINSIINILVSFEADFNSCVLYKNSIISLRLNSKIVRVFTLPMLITLFTHFSLQAQEGSQLQLNQAKADSTNSIDSTISQVDSTLSTPAKAIPIIFPKMLLKQKLIMLLRTLCA